MKKFRVKVKFNFFNQGDIVGETEYNKYGSQYFDPIVDKKEDIVDYTKEQNVETVTTPGADETKVTDESVNTDETPDKSKGKKKK